MRKVLLAPLLILFPLAGLEAWSTNGQTPGAAVLRGGLGDWALETIEVEKSPREDGVSTVRQPVANAAGKESIDLKAAKGNLQAGPLLPPGLPTCFIDAEGHERDIQHLRIDERDLLDDPTGVPGIGESGMQKLVAEVSTPASDFVRNKEGNTSGQD